VINVDMRARVLESSSAEAGHEPSMLCPTQSTVAPGPRPLTRMISSMKKDSCSALAAIVETDSSAIA